MADLHLEILRQPQRRLWDLFQREALVFTRGAYVLAGGTALALQIGHRESHDFDFFSPQSGVATVRSWIEGMRHATIRDADANTLHTEISTVKVSFIAAYRYPFLNTPLPAGAILLARIEDIALMKLLALTHRAAVRDYIDLAIIVRDHCSLPILLARSHQKYGPNFNVMLALRTLTHYDDLDDDLPALLDATLADTWQDILREAVKQCA